MVVSAAHSPMEQAYHFMRSTFTRKVKAAFKDSLVEFIPKKEQEAAIPISHIQVIPFFTRRRQLSFEKLKVTF